MAVDVRALWNFRDPAGSRERFLAALAEPGTDGDDALVLRTQVARTFGMEKDFDAARAELAAVEAQATTAGPRVQAFWWLETGRTWVSAVHPRESRTDEALATARDAYERCIRIAQAGGEDALVVDAIHMLAFVDPDPADGVRHADRGLAVAAASSAPEARRWEATLRNNKGVALGQLGRHEESLAEYEQALALTEPRGDATATRIAHWMVANAQRLLGRLDEAEATQLRLEAEWDADGEPDPYVFEELQAIYTAKGDTAKAEHYAARHAAASS